MHVVEKKWFQALDTYTKKRIQEIVFVLATLNWIQSNGQYQQKQCALLVYTSECTTAIITEHDGNYGLCAFDAWLFNIYWIFCWF